LTDPETDALGIAFRLGVEDVDRAARLVAGGGDRIEALHAALARGEERREKVLELLDRNEVGKAKRLALCKQQSVQLECPDEDLAGGCGSDDNYVPARCGLRICPDCATAQKAEKMEKYKPVVKDMENPTFATFTIENVDDFERGFDFILDSFGRLRNRTIPPSGETVRYKDGEEIVKRWDWTDDGRPAELWKPHLLENGKHELARRIQNHYVHAEWSNATGTHRGKNIPFEELVRGGIYAMDIVAKPAEDGAGYNVHLHAVVDMVYVPQAALSAVWEDITGAPVVDVRRIYDRSEEGIQSALMETVGYALKEPEFETTEAEVEYQLAMSDRRLVNPFGDLHGNIPDQVSHLKCSNCGHIPYFWNYKGLVDGELDTMEVVVGGPDGDRPPPE
jgi:hypothetical protein